MYAPDADVVIGIVKTNLVLVSRYNSEGVRLPLKNHEGVQIALLKLKSDNTNEMQELRDEYTFNVNWRF